MLPFVFDLHMTYACFWRVVTITVDWFYASHGQWRTEHLKRLRGRMKLHILIVEGVENRSDVIFNSMNIHFLQGCESGDCLEQKKLLHFISCLKESDNFRWNISPYIYLGWRVQRLPKGYESVLHNITWHTCHILSILAQHIFSE
jgi:hypothetical protein